LKACYRITDASLTALKELPITRLNVSQCGELKGTFLAHFSALEVLNLGHCKEFDRENFKHLQRHKTLTDLDCTYMDGITRDDLKLLSTATRLKKLSLYWCPSIDELEGFDALTNLTELDLSYVPKLTNSSLTLLGKMQGFRFSG
jgi:hypothetical protein